MPETIQTRSCYIFLVLLLVSISSSVAQGQGPTTSFTYQGRLTDGGTAANGNYDLQFALFDNASGPTQIATQTIPNVPVSAGIFTVQLDFNASAFPGAPRVRVRGERARGEGGA